ncbi:MAG: GNAT family N-acetyltransferase, partial [Armatimonadota bacterium]|nr:GNAT family N-acetyltransferase [Armatimonadota bacterium]
HVEEAWRRRGIATAMAASVLREAREAGCRLFAAASPAADPAASGVARNLGWRVADRLRVYSR